MGSPGLPHILIVRLETAYDPGWSQLSHHDESCAVACWRLETIGPSKAVISGLYTFTVSFICYHCSSPAFVPTHQAHCYQFAYKARYPARG